MSRLLYQDKIQVFVAVSAIGVAQPPTGAPSHRARHAAGRCGGVTGLQALIFIFLPFVLLDGASRDRKQESGAVFALVASTFV